MLNLIDKGVSALKKAILSIGLSSLFIISGCSTNGDNDKSMDTNTAEPLTVRTPAHYYDEDYQNTARDRDDFGFTRVNKTTVEGQNIDNQISSIDREQLADVISNLSIQLPNVRDVSTLVTDEEVLVVYETDSNNRQETADQVKRTAMSAVPRYYHVYVSDNIALAPYIENYANLESDHEGMEFSLNKTIQEMLKSPQGSKISDEENENGENVTERHNNKNIHENTRNM